MFKKNQRVLVSYDGKGARCTNGKITAIRGCAVRVTFVPWGERERGEISEWFMPQVCKDFGSKYYQRYGKFVNPKGVSIMKHMLGLPGDWYSVYLYDTDLALRSGLINKKP